MVLQWLLFSSFKGYSMKFGFFQQSAPSLCLKAGHPCCLANWAISFGDVVCHHFCSLYLLNQSHFIPHSSAGSSCGVTHWQTLLSTPFFSSCSIGFLLFALSSLLRAAYVAVPQVSGWTDRHTDRQTVTHTDGGMSLGFSCCCVGPLLDRPVLQQNLPLLSVTCHVALNKYACLIHVLNDVHMLKMVNYLQNGSGGWARWVCNVQCKDIFF